MTCFHASFTGSARALAGANDPPQIHGRSLDPAPIDGVLVKNIGMRPICPGFLGPDNCRLSDGMSSDTDRSVRVTAMQNLRGCGLEWGEHGFIETVEQYIQSSSHRLWLPGLWFWHFSFHPRSS